MKPEERKVLLDILEVAATGGVQAAGVIFDRFIDTVAQANNVQLVQSLAHVQAQLDEAKAKLSTVLSATAEHDLNADRVQTLLAEIDRMRLNQIELQQHVTQLKAVNDNLRARQDMGINAQLDWADAAFQSCVYLDKAVPVEGLSNSERIRWAADLIVQQRESLRLKDLELVTYQLEINTLQSQVRDQLGTYQAELDTLRQQAKDLKDTLATSRPKRKKA